MKRIKQISVKNLFGMFDHTIPLNLDERITIMHGPNGFGKTAMLRLLVSLFGQDNSALRSIPFSEFRVQFEDGTDLWADRPSTIGGEIASSYAASQEIYLHFAVSLSASVITLPLTFFLRSDLLRRRDKKTIIYKDLKEKEEEEKRENHIRRNTKLFNGVRRSVVVHFIETQRLLNTGDILGDFNENQSKAISELDDDPFEVVNYTPDVDVDMLAVTAYSQELARIIKTKLAESSTISQSLDRTFPARLVNPRVQKGEITEEALRIKLIELERKRQYLTSTGLLDQEGADSIQVQEQDQINESTKVVLSVYAEDTEKKLGIFDELANKIDLLKRIINKRFLYKEMTISKEKGFVFTNSNGVVLSPNELSSGEQHELILFYELLFKVAPGSLILIDEPEISLHVVWQEQFLEDVQAVTRLSDIDVLLATHSPDIIAGRRDLMVELKGPV